MQKFKTKNSSASFWAGFARQTIDFQHALGELLDNAISATKKKKVGTGNDDAVVEVVIEELDDGNLEIIVADAGSGVEWHALTGDNNIFNLGYRPDQSGHMNEHGFGLKNALALMTSGFTQTFDFFTRPASKGGNEVYKVAGPISEEMTAYKVDMKEWGKGLEIVVTSDSGTKIRVGVRKEYFATIYSRTVNFETLVARLAEHLGVMYSLFIAKGAQIHVRYKSKAAAGWTTKIVPSIPTPFLQNEEVKKIEQQLKVEYAGKEYTATYVQGLLDPSIKQPEAEQKKGWPYPLKIHFQGSNARCGVSFIVRDRVLKTGVFREIWPEHGGNVSFNRFIGELHLDASFSTTNNKTDLDPHSIVWPLIKEKLHENFQPENVTQKQTEENFRKKVIQQVATVHGLSKSTMPAHKSVWEGSAEIDVYYSVGAENICMELKVNQAQVIDVYQTLMYWDGLVADGISPSKAILVADSFPSAVSKAIKAANARKDAKGNSYSIEAQDLAKWKGK